jgi:hypothetical protein
MQQGPFCEVNRITASQEITHILCNPNLCHPPVHILSQINLVFTPVFNFYVCTCHHGMGRPQVAEGGKNCSIESGLEYMEYVVAGSRQQVFLRLAA